MLLKAAFHLIAPKGPSAKLSILIFHRVLPEPDPLFPDEVDAARFDAIVGWLTQWFNILPLNQALQQLRSGGLPARAAAITFDDGYADNLTLAAPILRRHGATATFFIATGFLNGGRMWNDTVIESVRRTALSQLDAGFLGLGVLDLASIDAKRTALAGLIPAIKHMVPAQRDAAVAQVAEVCAAPLPNDLMLTSEQLKQLHGLGMGIGAHTVSHPILASTSDAAARKEIADGRDFLEGLLRQRIGLFAYPNGRIGTDYNASHTDMVKRLGFDAALTTNWGASRQRSDVFQLPRFTPWDRGRARFALRLLLNTRQTSPAVH